MQNHPVMRMQLKVSGNMVFDGPLNGIDILAGGDARPVPEPENMGIDRLGRLPPPHIQYHIRCLATDTGQGLQSRA